MLYTLLTRSDVDAIEEILTPHKIEYIVSVNEDLIESQNESAKQIVDRHGQVRRTEALLNLTIEKSEFEKIPLESQRRLERYNIYPEMTDIPFRTDHSEIDSIHRPTEAVPSTLARVMVILGLLLSGFFAMARLIDL